MGKPRKRGKDSSKVSVKSSIKKPDRLDILKKKLELEQEMLDSGKALKRTKKVEDNEEMPEEEPDIKKSMDEFQNIMDNAPAPKVEEDFLTKVQNKNLEKKIKIYQGVFQRIEAEVGKIIIGQKETLRGMIRAVLADGHVLVEGVPGIAKTTLIRALANTMACSFARIQFTPDLLPTDIIGISTYQEGRGFYTLKGPIFNHFILADEINRAPPKVQSALLEAMAERQATIAKETFDVPLPFFTMATQNPIEHVGTYTLPEAQIDRFLFKLYMGYPNIDEEQKILRTNIMVKNFTDYIINPVLSPESILQMQADTKKIFVDKKVERYIVKIVDATRLPKKYGITLGKYVEFGASPRGSIGLMVAARADAMMSGQAFVTPHNVKNVALDVLRHRLLMTYEGQAEGVKTEDIIQQILKKIPVP